MWLLRRGPIEGLRSASGRRWVAEGGGKSRRRHIGTFFEGSVIFSQGIKGDINDLLCDISTFGDRHAIVNQSREFSDATDLFPERRRCQAVLTRRKLDIVVETELVELPCCADTA